MSFNSFFLVLALVAIWWQNIRCNFGRGHYGEHLYEIILYLAPRFTRYLSKIFLFSALVAILFSQAEP